MKGFTWHVPFQSEAEYDAGGGEEWMPGFDQPESRARKDPYAGRFLKVTADLVISEEDLEESFVRAPGPGGQHVNKASTAVQLRFRAAGIRRLPAEVQARLTEIAGSRLTSQGDLLITARRHRSQERNRADARARLIALLRRATERKKARRPGRPPKAAVEKRLQAKRRRGERKRERRPPSLET